ncbi:MAG: hypothetical protein V1706_11585 [Pseudomonadota bacterium]
MTMTQCNCILPGGYVDQRGQAMRDLLLLPLNGFCERLIAGSLHLSAPALTTALLANCIARIGDIEDVPEWLVRDLLVGDRQFLLLKLREITFGRDIRAVISCAWQDCGKKMDIDFTIDSIPVKTVPQLSLHHTMTLSEESGGIQVTFRLPNGSNQEALFSLAEEDEMQAADLLLARCIKSIGPLAPPLPADITNLSSKAKEEIEKAMETLGPKLDLTMEAFCPECRRMFAASFDLEHFILDELRTSLDALLQEVHYLAFHYHWSETEILGMTRENRRRYIEILSAQMERIHDSF